MSSQGNNRPTNETPFLQIDSATFQAAVIAAVKVIMSHLNASNASKNRNGVDNSNLSNNQRNQRVSTYKNTPTHKPKNMKQKF